MGPNVCVFVQSSFLLQGVFSFAAQMQRLAECNNIYILNKTTNLNKILQHCNKEKSCTHLEHVHYGVHHIGM